MPANTIMTDIAQELKRAKKKHPNWPDHIVSRAAIVGEESGELIRACLNWKYERGQTSEDRSKQIDEIRTEAIQVAATVIRFLESLDKTDFTGNKISQD